jgi:capsular polysaccharide biosynthesis protein
MSTQRLLEVLRTRWTWLVAGLVIGLVAAGLALAVLPRTYSSEAAILVEAELTEGDAASFSATGFVEERLPTYVDLGRADAVHQDIRELLNRDLTREQIESRVSYGATPGSMVLSITGTGETPAAAQDTADAATTALATSIEVTSSDSVEVTTSLVQGATLPTGPEDPDPMVVLPAGALLGLAIPLLLALVIPARGARTALAARPAPAAPTARPAPLAPAARSARTARRRADTLEGHLP